MLDGELYQIVNKDLINYYSSPGNIYRLAKFGQSNKCNLDKMKLKEFLKIIIKNNFYKKDNFIKFLVYDLIEFYFSKINLPINANIHNNYNYFLKRISTTKTFNLDEESFFIEFENEILNG